MRRWIDIWMALAIVSFATVAFSADKPNVILFMADDMGAEALGCYNSTTCNTPNLDRLAKEGMLFENAYTSPLCTPTRVMLMTGRHPHKTGFRRLISKELDVRMPKDFVTFGSYFKNAGYATAIAGKWQLGYFDSYPDMLSEFGFDEHAMWVWRWHGKKHSRYYEPGLWTDGKFSTGTPEEYGPDKYSARMLEFIDKKKDTPFFIYYSMALTHDPFEMPPDCEAEATKFLKGNESAKTRNFAGMTYYTDKIVGQFVDKLEEHGLTDNTLILFTADNGTKGDIVNQLKTVSVSGGKASMTEQGARIPFIVRWPGKVAAGVRSDKMIGLVDVVPTLNAIIGAENDEKVDGLDLSHYFYGTGGKERDHFFICLSEKYFVRDHRFRLHNDGRFYDISTKSDMTRYSEKETTQFPEQKERLQKIMDMYKMDQYPFSRKNDTIGTPEHRFVPEWKTELDRKKAKRDRRRAKASAGE